MTERIPAEIFPPGEYVKDELESRGWSQADLATIMGRPVQLVNGIISGKKNITPETAQDLGEAFGTSAELWVGMEGTYRLGLLRKKEAAEGKNAGEIAERRRLLEKKQALLEKAPFKEMVKRNWVEPCSTADEIERQLNCFFGVKVLEQSIELPFAFAARKSSSYCGHTPAQLAWVLRASSLANLVGAAKYDKKTFASGLADLHKLVAHEAAVRHVPRMLANLGVRFVVVEHLTGTRMDGATFWINDRETPVIVMSLRYDRIDNFWFTLAHELAHVFHDDECSIDDNLVGEGANKTEQKPDFEMRADKWASNYLVRDEDMNRFILRTHPLYSKQSINQFANRIKVHPGIIAGQLHGRGMHPSQHREMLVKVKEKAIESAMVDGWGHTPKVG